MNCENCKYPTLCKVTIIGISVVSALSAGWLYYRMKSSKSSLEKSKPTNDDSTTQPDVNM